MSRLARAGIVVLLVVLACDSPFEPRGQGERVPIGTIIEDAVTGDSARHYSFAAQPGAPYAVFLEARQHPVFLSVQDSARTAAGPFLSAGPSSPPFEENATGLFSAPHGGVFMLEVRPSPPGRAARFRFEIYEIKRAPELRSPRFTLGDTMSGETIDPIVDLDQFVAHGDSGQEIVAVVETQGPHGSGSVALDVVDSVANTFLGYVFADAVDSNPRTTGRMRLTGTHDYQFTLSSVISNQYPRYRGPYRFWTYVINRGPEHRAAAIVAGAEIRGEKIDRAGDVDEFTFAAPAGAEFNAFLQAARAFQFEVGRPTGPPLASGQSAASDTGLFAHATGRFQIPQGGSYVLRVSGANPSFQADTGAYRVYLYPVDRRPEHGSSVIAPGDTIGDAIDLPGDVDEFTFSGTAGEEYNAFLQAESGSPDTYLQLDVVGSAGTRLAGVNSSGTDTSLLRQATGRFALPTTDTHLLRVSGTWDRTERDRGPYRLLLYKVNRRPETTADTIALGDSVSREAIDMPGDVDEWRTTVKDTIGVNLVVRRGSANPEGTVSAQLLDAAGRTIGSAYSFGAGPDVVSGDQTGRLVLAPGTYLVRVEGAAGSYRLWLYAFKIGPETVRDTFALGDTVSGESIDPLGDIDRFWFYAEKGQHVNIAFQALGGALAANLSSPVSGGPTWRGTVWSGGAAASLHDHQSLRVDLAETGWYQIGVAEASSPKPSPDERGPYRFAVELQATAPEHTPVALSPGDSVVAEAIDFPGDWDEFLLTATPGQDLNVIFQTPGSPGYPWLVALDATTGDTVGRVVGQSFEKAMGPIRAPPSGQIRIAVSEPRGPYFGSCYDATCGNVFRFVGPYRFRVVAVNRAPENVPASFVVGDTVRGEAILPAGDIDEFRSSGIPGDTLKLELRLVANPVPAGSFITPEVLNPATGAMLAGGWSVVLASQEYVGLDSFVVPAGGVFMVRVRGGGTFGDEVGTAPYEFFVKRGP